MINTIFAIRTRTRKYYSSIQPHGGAVLNTTIHAPARITNTTCPPAYPPIPRIPYRVPYQNQARFGNDAMYVPTGQDPREFSDARPQAVGESGKALNHRRARSGSGGAWLASDVMAWLAWRHSRASVRACPRSVHWYSMHWNVGMVTRAGCSVGSLSVVHGTVRYGWLAAAVVLGRSVGAGWWWLLGILLGIDNGVASWLGG